MVFGNQLAKIRTLVRALSKYLTTWSSGKAECIALKPDISEGAFFRVAASVSKNVNSLPSRKQKFSEASLYFCLHVGQCFIAKALELGCTRSSASHRVGPLGFESCEDRNACITV